MMFAKKCFSFVTSSPFLISRMALSDRISPNLGKSSQIADDLALNDIPDL